METLSDFLKEAYLDFLKEAKQVLSRETIANELKRIIKQARKKYKYMRIEYGNSHVTYTLKKNSYLPHAFRIKVHDTLLIVNAETEDYRGKETRLDIYPLYAITNITFSE